MVSEVFKQAQSGHMEQFDSSQENDSSYFRSFSGTGYRLGQTEDDSVAIASSSKGKKAEEPDTVTVKVFRQGFTVDDGELRSYEDPRNREFFESITRNEIPQELRKQNKAMVHVNVENHLGEDYVKQAPRFKAFSGSGNVLGSPAPVVTSEISTTTSGTGNVQASNAENEAKASSDLNVNQSEPTTMISIRLNDGTRISARFNLTHTIQDIRQFIVTARPEYSGRNFSLLTTFPNKELTDQSQTIQQAGLQNAAILQRLK
jgi:UBX domain-containing protein 1